MPDTTEHNIILGADNVKLLDRDCMMIFTINDFGLTTTEIETAKVLMKDGWLGSIDELLDTVKRLDN